MIAIFLSTFKKSEDGYSSSWKYYVSFFFVSAASVGLTFKAFGKSSASHFSSDMMAVSALVMVVFCLITVLLGGGFSIKQFRCGSVKKFIAAALISGALSCAYNRLNIFLSANVDAIIFFPFFNGGVCLLSAVMGIIMCKDKLSKEQFSGIALGIIAICIIGIL